MVFSKTTDRNKQIVNSVEGKPLKCGILVSSLINGEEMTMLEVRLHPGDHTPLHKHTHESIIYVVNGKLKASVGDESYVLGQGDACLHPRQVQHCVEALEESTVVEIKSAIVNLT